ncbi:MAG: methyltransferase [Deltaproteobacteria bacterium]|nr:methyltransferase [Deltaproteobacteria bacterium]
MTTQTTVDALYDGKLKLKQSKSGYRYSIDSIVLAAFAESARERTLDLGCGVGVVALQLWLEQKSERLVGLEVQASLARLAHANVVLNDAEENILIVTGDLRDSDVVKKLGEFDRVVMNPPYWPAKAGRLPPNEEKAIAKHKLLGGLEEWVKAAATALGPTGILECVYPSERLADLMWRCTNHRLNPVELTIVHTRPRLPATLALLRCEKDGRSGLKVTNPWVVYGKDGKPNARYPALEGFKK